jgi:signal transduction histidine kinase
MDTLVGGVRSLVSAVARLPDVKTLDQPSCNEQLDALTKEYLHDIALTVADAKGEVLCSSRSSHVGAAVADHTILREVVDTGQFRIGAYARCPITNANTISFGYPINDDSGHSRGVVLAYLSLDWLEADLQRAPFVRGQQLTIADRTGVVLAQAPRPVLKIGQKLPAPLLEMIRAATPGLMGLRDVQGRLVSYGYIPITVPPANVYVLYGIERDVAFQPIYLAAWRSAGLSLLSVLGALIIAWVIGVRSIRRPVQRLVDAARSWQRGDYAARAGLASSAPEIRDLGLAFDTMAEKLQLHEQQLASANRIKDIILAAAGHDLRQPLQVITMAISGLCRRPLTDRERQLAGRAEHAVERLAGGLDQLIDASRVRFGMAEPQRRPFSLAPLLREIAEQWSARATEKDLRLRVHRCCIAVESDPRMLSTIMRNLVGNAIKYTEHGGVLIGCRRRHAELWIEIYDTGIGIPQDRIDSIFGELQQLDPRREGLGLGLWIARTTVEALGHDLSVRSIVGRGSRFRVVVPLASVEPDAG